MSLNQDEEMNNESDRAFCFFFIGFHEEKYMCLLCNHFSRCEKDADKMKRACGKLLWEFDWNNPKERGKSLTQSENEKKVKKKVEKKDSSKIEEETDYEKEMRKFQKGSTCPVCG